MPAKSYKAAKYRRIIEALEKHIMRSNIQEYYWGNTRTLRLDDPAALGQLPLGAVASVEENKQEEALT